MACVECLSDTDCLTAGTICSAHACHAVSMCRSSRECPAQVCDPTLGYCVDCVTAVDCPTGQLCVSSSCTASSADGGGPRDGGGAPDTGGDVHDGGIDAPFVRDAGPPARTDEIDLLLMIDNSNSMTEEQGSVVGEVPRIVQILTSGHDPTGVIPDFTPARSLHIGIVDSDMGLGTTTGIATCNPGLGDDGLMQIRARHPGTGCMADYSSIYAGNIFQFVFGTGRTPVQFATDVACVATLGTNGCGFEFELESPLKAISLTPTATGESPVAWTQAGYRPPVFYGSTFGHGDDPATNGGFLRPDSVLAVVTINDEDDCSTPNPGIFSVDDPTYNTVNLNLRCHTFADQLFPVQRYADGFLGLRAHPSRLVYAAITGVPPAVAGMDPAVILADPNMTERVNPAMTNQLLPACVSPGGRGVAYPAIRMTQLAQLLNASGATTTVQSICNTDFGPAFDVIIDALARSL